MHEILILVGIVTVIVTCIFLIDSILTYFFERDDYDDGIDTGDFKVDKDDENR